MFNNRMLAVAAVLVMAVPALGAATPIVVPPITEQLVEGHTVFTVIEIVKATRTTESRFAAAVAVLVREYVANQRARRFPGVLWFNDQYLVNPLQEQRANDYYRYPCGGAVLAVNEGDPDPRVAIMRVTSPVDTPVGDQNPDSFAGAPYVTGALEGEGGFAGTDTDTTNYTYRSNRNWIEPDADHDGDGVDDEYYYGQDSDPANDPDAPSDYAWVGVNPNTGANDPVYSDTVVGSTVGGIDKGTFNATAPWDYDESYLITDPNDHSWVIDKYYFYTRDGVNTGSQNADNLVTKLTVDPDDPDNDPATPDPNGVPSSEHYPTDTWGGELRTVYEFPVWAVNILGSPVFIPDGGNSDGGLFTGEALGENCMPFRDLLEETVQPVNGAACGAAIDNGNALGTGADTDLTLSPGQPVAPFTDDPCMGYMEPSRNGYCYGGQDATDEDLDGDVDKDDCLAARAAGNQNSAKPLRLYNALLYFKLEDLRVEGEAKDHSDPVNSVDTNGCSDEVHWWDTQPEYGDGNPNYVTNGVPNTESYDCPADNDDLEGNSHSFHPSAPVHEEREACLPQFGGPNPTNHGGSTYISVDQRTGDDGWYDAWTPCDYMHATRNIDIYFSGAGRPFPPVVRNFDVLDLEGSSAPFQDFHSAYPGVSP